MNAIELLESCVTYYEPEPNNDAFDAPPAFKLAHHLWSEGFSILPLAAGTKRPVVKWKRLQTERCSFSELQEWFLHNNFFYSKALTADKGLKYTWSLSVTN